MITGHAPATSASLSHSADAYQCTKLIRKLRWIGLDEEASRLEQALLVLAPEQRRTVLADPSSTD
jgi:hypothetical protein